MSIQTNNTMINNKDTHHLSNDINSPLEQSPPPSYNYYPSAPIMEMDLNNNQSPPPPHQSSKIKFELNLIHDQLLKIKSLTNTTNTTQDQQQQQNQQQEQPIKCTVCYDKDKNIIFYRPSMALHTLFQVQDEDEISLISGSRYELTINNNNGNNNNSKHLSISNSNSMVTISGNGKGNYHHKMDNMEMNDKSKINNNDSYHHHSKTKDLKINDSIINHNNTDDDDDDDDDDDINIDGIYQKSSTMNMGEDDDDDLDQHQRLVIPKHMQQYVTLYDGLNDQHKPLWCFIEQNWHYMTFLPRQSSFKPITMTTSTFSFFWDQQQNQNQTYLFPYRWHMHMNDHHDEQQPTMDLLLELYQPELKKRELIASLTQKATKFIIFKTDMNNDPILSISETTTSSFHLQQQNDNNSIKKISSNNPFRHLNENNNNSYSIVNQFDSFIVISGLLLYDLIQSQLRALGGGKEAMMMMIDRQQEAIKEEEEKLMNSFHHDIILHNEQQKGKQIGMIHVNDDLNNDLDDDLDNDRIHSAYYTQELDYNSRWSSNGSMKSLELDPGIWRCWWGYGCWWNIFPCCMPGGWCDRLFLKVRGLHKHPSHSHHHHRHRSKVTRRMQGWQQQQEE